MQEIAADPRRELADRLRTLKADGCGRVGPKAPNYGSGRHWSDLELIDTMSKLGQKVGEVSTVAAWFDAANPKRPGKRNWQCLLRLFFPGTEAAVVRERDELDVLWKKTWQSPQSDAHRPDSSRRSNYPQDWQLVGWHDFEGMVNLTTYHPEPEMAGDYSISGTLKFGTVTRDDEAGIRCELSIRAGVPYLNIPKGNYHCLPESMIGEDKNKHDNFQPCMGGVAIEKPEANGLLHGNTTGSGKTLASVTEVRSGGQLKVRVLAPLNGIVVAGRCIQDGVTREFSREEIALLKLLLKEKGVRQEPDGKLVLAEQRWVRRAKR